MSGNCYSVPCTELKRPEAEKKRISPPPISLMVEQISLTRKRDLKLEECFDRLGASKKNVYRNAGRSSNFKT